MKHSDWKHRFKCRRSFYVLGGAIALLPIIFGCQKAMSAKNHLSPPVPPAPAPGPAIEPSPVEVPFAIPIKTYRTIFSEGFVSPNGQWVIGRPELSDDFALANGDGKIVKKLPSNAAAAAALIPIPITREKPALSRIDGKIVKDLPSYGLALFPYGTVSPWSPDGKKLLTLSPHNGISLGNFLVYPFTDKIGKSINLHAPGSVINTPVPLFSPNGRYVAAGVTMIPDLSWNNSLVTWDINLSPASPVFGPRMFTFRLNVDKIAWLDNQHLWVITRGNDLSNDKYLHDHTEIYLLDCESGESRPVKELTTGYILNISPYTDEEGHLMAVVEGKNYEEDLEAFDTKTEECIYQIPLDPPYPNGNLRHGTVNSWEVVGNARYVYVYCFRNSNSYVDIRHYDQNSGTLGKTYHLDITAVPSIDNSGQVWGIKNGAGKKNGVLLNFGKLE